MPQATALLAMGAGAVRGHIASDIGTPISLIVMTIDYHKVKWEKLVLVIALGWIGSIAKANSSSELLSIYKSAQREFQTFEAFVSRHGSIEDLRFVIKKGWGHQNLPNLILKANNFILAEESGADFTFQLTSHYVKFGNGTLVTVPRPFSFKKYYNYWVKAHKKHVVLDLLFPVAQANVKEVDKVPLLMATMALNKLMGKVEEEPGQLRRELISEADSCQKKVLLLNRQFQRLVGPKTLKSVNCSVEGPDKLRRMKRLVFQVAGSGGAPNQRVEIEFDYGGFDLAPVVDPNYVVGAKVTYTPVGSDSPSHYDVYKRFENGKYLGQSPALISEEPTSVDLDSKVHLSQTRRFSDPAKAMLQNFSIMKSEEVRKHGNGSERLIRKTMTQRGGDYRELPTLRGRLWEGQHDVFMTLKSQFGLDGFLLTSSCCHEEFWTDVSNGQSNECQKVIDKGFDYCSQPVQLQENTEKLKTSEVVR